MKLGIDPVHFGIIMVVNMEIGMCHPPVGLNLYVASGSPRWASPSSPSRSGRGC
jgi:TRAP-type C4-dicarboxylate transport system permease large subunit